MTMEALKEILQNLPDSERCRLLIELLTTTRSASNSCAETNPEIYNHCCGLRRISELNSPEHSDTKKTQKTLDSWLIKPNDSSSKKQNELCQTKTQDISNLSETSLHSKNKLPINNTKDTNCTRSPDSFSIRNEFSDDINHTNRRENVEKNANSPNAEKNNVVTEKYNLRSKRKFSKLSPSNEFKESTIKQPKRANNIGDKNKDFNFCETTGSKKTENLKSKTDMTVSQVTENCIIQQSSFSNKPFLDHVSSNDQKIEQRENNNLNNLDVSANSKQFHKNKTGKCLIKIGGESSTSTIPLENISNELDVWTSQSNEPTLTTTVSQQSNYKEFYKLNTECSRVGLNIFDILSDKNIQNLFNGHKSLNNDALACIGSFKSSAGKVLPVVHLLESKKKLLENLCVLQKMQK